MCALHTRKNLFSHYWDETQVLIFFLGVKGSFFVLALALQIFIFGSDALSLQLSSN